MPRNEKGCCAWQFSSYKAEVPTKSSKGRRQGETEPVARHSAHGEYELEDKRRSKSQKLEEDERLETESGPKSTSKYRQKT